MAKKTVENEQLMGDAREVINDNFTELYTALDGTSSPGTTIATPSGVNHENFKNVYQLSTANENRAEFYSTLPDFIIIGDDYQTETLFLHSISGPLANYFTYQYQSISYDVTDSVRKNVRFNTDADGTLWNATTGHSNPQSFLSSLLLGYTSLKDFIDNDRAGYFGGSSSSGGASSSGGSSIGDNIHIQSESQFDQVVPSYIIMAGGTAPSDGTGGKGLCIYQFRQLHLNDNTIQYYDVYKGDEYVWFNNDSQGTFNEQSSVGGFYSFHTTSQQPSLKQLCDSNYAGYSSSGGSSNGLSTSTTSAISNTTHFKNTIVTTQNIPDALVVDCDGVKVCFTLDQVSEAQLKWTMSGTNNNHWIRFTNVADPVFVDCGYPGHGISSSGKLFDLISDGTIEALYYGGQPSSGVKAWSVFDGTANYDADNYLPIKASENVESVKYISTGIYEVTLTNPMPSEHYSVSVDCNPSGYGGAFGGVMDLYNNGSVDVPTASKFRIDVRTAGNAQVNSNRITFHVVA